MFQAVFIPAFRALVSLLKNVNHSHPTEEDMRQFWKIVNIDKKESWRNRGGLKLGEFFFNSNTNLLKRLINSAAPATHNPTIGSWAGDRIICIGDYTSSLPLGVITKDDAPLVKELLGSEEEPPWEANGVYSGPPFAEALYGEATPISAKSRISWRNQMEKDPEVFPPDSTWILRNLSKKEFVRSDIISGNKYCDDKHDAFSARPGLYQVLLMWIAWTEDPSSVTDKGISVNRGRWAGDRFDLVLFTDEVEATYRNEGWSDVSQTAFRSISEIYSEI